MKSLFHRGMYIKNSWNRIISYFHYNEPNPLADTAVYVSVELVFFNFKLVKPPTFIDRNAYRVDPEVCGYNWFTVL